MISETHWLVVKPNQCGSAKIPFEARRKSNKNLMALKLIKNSKNNRPGLSSQPKSRDPDSWIPATQSRSGTSFAGMTDSFRFCKYQKIANRANPTSDS